MSKFDLYVSTLLEASKTKEKKLDFSKDDVNNDGKVNKTDGYLKKRNAAIATAIAKKSKGKKDAKKS
jgi:hypothetical protein